MQNPLPERQPSLKSTVSLSSHDFAKSLAEETAETAAVLLQNYFRLLTAYTGDGKLDLAVAKLFSNDVSILLGNGDGTFEGSADVISIPQSILAENMYDAAKLDLALAKLLSENPRVLVLSPQGTSMVTASWIWQ